MEAKSRGTPLPIPPLTRPFTKHQGAREAAPDLSGRSIGVSAELSLRQEPTHVGIPERHRVVRRERSGDRSPDTAARIGRDQVRLAGHRAREPGGNLLQGRQRLRRSGSRPAHAEHRQHPDPHQGPLPALELQVAVPGGGRLREPEAFRRSQMGDGPARRLSRRRARPGAPQGVRQLRDPHPGAAGLCERHGRDYGRADDRRGEGLPEGHHHQSLQRLPGRETAHGVRSAAAVRRDGVRGARALAPGLPALRDRARRLLHHLHNTARGSGEGHRRARSDGSAGRPRQVPQDEGGPGARERRQ